MLGADDLLPRRPRRLLVAGTSGAGKTFVAARLGEVLDVPHVEIDALFHGPDWTPRSQFYADVQAFSACSAWVTEWQYDSARDLLAERADLLVWLDLPRMTVMRQVIQRTVQRRLRRQALWNGNREPPLRTIATDADHIVRWAWRTHADSTQRITATEQRHPQLVVVRLGSRREIRRWIAGPVRTATSASA
jgi:adenylate kinase family enzyme